MDKIYFHELLPSHRMIEMKEHSFGEILETYKQPDWCLFDDALNGLFGCTSLLTKVIDKKYCSECNYFKNLKK